MNEIPTTVKNKELVEKRREQIVLAAIDLFSKKGFHKSTLRDLAEELGVSHASIYDYISSKEDIFFLIHDFLDQLAMETIEKSVENIQNPIDKLRRLIRGEFKLMGQWANAHLLLYQETHVLKDQLLKELLRKERDHVERFELVIEEAINQGQARDCNLRLVANLIKSMIDSWVIRQWDLRGAVGQLEAERTIFDLISNGLLLDNTHKSNLGLLSNEQDLDGKSALVVNGSTFIGKAICEFLQSKGAKVACHVEKSTKSSSFPAVTDRGIDDIKFYSAKEFGPMSNDLFLRIEEEIGPVDIYIQEMGIGNIGKSPDYPNDLLAGRQLEANLICANNIANYLQKYLSKRVSGRILYIAPWAWDKYTCPVYYESTKAGTISLTETMAKAMAPAMINVNCIVPGYVSTGRSARTQKELVFELEDKNWTGRLSEISDMLNGVLFFVGDYSGDCSGQKIGYGL